MLGGVKMGSKFPPNPRGASYLSRARMGEDFLPLIPAQYISKIFPDESHTCTYAQLKHVVGHRNRTVKEAVIEALGGWPHNDGDGGFILG
jgi:hypothetical protein